MTMKPKHLLLTMAAIGATLSLAEVSAAAHSYYITESVEYQNHGCGNANSNLPYYLNAIAYSLGAAGWTGLYYAKDGDWPQVYVDGCIQSDGFDLISDTHDLVIEAHHGSIGSFVFGYPSPTGRCSVSLKNDMRLGSMFGATASTAVFASCCTLNRNHIAGYRQLAVDAPEHWVSRRHRIRQRNVRRLVQCDSGFVQQVGLVWAF
jgi:hypothetical protein